MRYRHIAEVEKALAQRLDMAKTEKSFEGFTMVPWPEVSRTLDSVFGPFGWSERIVSSFSDAQAGVYSVTREVTVTVADDDGTLYTKTVTGVGTSVVKGEGGKAHKTASMGADSLSFSKATKKLGDAFGLFLYDDDEAGGKSESAGPRKASSGTSSSGGNSGGGNDFRPSEKQLFVLTKKAGYTEEDVDGMSFKEWKAALDAFFKEGTTKPKGRATKAAAPARKTASSFFGDDDEDDEATA